MQSLLFIFHLNLPVARLENRDKLAAINIKSVKNLIL